MRDNSFTLIATKHKLKKIFFDYLLTFKKIEI